MPPDQLPDLILDKAAQDMAVLDLAVRADAAVRQGDWSAALAHWQAVRLRASHLAEAWSGTATALRMLGRLDEADTVLRDGAEKFPDHAAMYFERAWLAQARANWPEAARLWGEIRMRFPASPGGYAGWLTVLRMQGRLKEAEALAGQTLRRFPDDAMLHIESAWIAQSRNDWPEAARRWAVVQDRFSDMPDGWLGACTVLRVQGRLAEAARLLEETAARFGATLPGVLIEAAWIAQSRHDWIEAARCWAGVRAEVPDYVEGFLQGAAALEGAGEAEAATRLLADAAMRFPANLAIAAALGRTLLAQHRWVEAQRVFSDLRARFPNDPGGHTGAAAALAGRGLLDEAERLLQAAASRLPDDPSIALQLARLPVAEMQYDRRDWREAAARLERLAQLFPRFAPAREELIQVLARAGQVDAAIACGIQAMADFPGHLAIAHRWALASYERDGGAAAVRRFQARMAAAPGDRTAAICLADALSRTGRHAEAEAILAGVDGEAAGSARFALVRASLATNRGKWPEAMERWHSARRRFPHDADIAAGLLQAELGAVDSGAAAEAAAARPAHADGDQAMLARFESLGGTPYGCEFGFVQRAHGVESLGLLRWTGVRLGRLLAALEAGFEGVGEPGQTELIRPALDTEEYLLRDRRFGLRSHTFIAPRDVAPDRMHAQACLRQQFLRRRLLQQLAEGTRIFVYRQARESLAAGEIRRLHQAIRAYGSGALLYVRQAESPAEAGRVESWADGLLVGRIARFAISPAGEHLGPATADWLALCRAAARLHG